MMQSFPLNLRRVIIWIGRLVLGGALIYAGYSKIVLPTMHPRPPIGVALAFFALTVGSYQMLPPWGVNFVAHTLPFAEVIIGLLLIIGWQIRIWATLTTLLILGFFTAVVRSYAMGLQINCGCFCYNSVKPGTELLHDAGLLVLALAVSTGAFLSRRVRRAVP